MLSHLTEHYLTLGSGRKFLEVAADRICTPSSYVLVHPATVCVSAALHLIVDELDSRRQQVCEVDVTEIDAEQLPKSFCIATDLDLDGSDARSIDAMQNQLQDVDVLHLSGFEQIDPDGKGLWIKFINDWTRIARKRIDQRAHATVLVAAMQLEPAMLDSLTIDTTMHVAWWWGIPSLLEFQLACRGEECFGSTAIETQWMEQMAVALSSGDLLFLEKIWPSLTERVTQLIRLMQEYAFDQEWTIESIEERFNGQLSQYLRGGFAPYAWSSSAEAISSQPPKHLQHAWSDGLLFFSPEYGCELHAAAVSVLDEKLALTRLWRAQLGLLSPQIDVARSMMCQELTDQLGKDWPVRYDRPLDERELEEVTKDPLSCQLGYLAHLLKKHGEYQYVNPAFRLLSERASDIRNELAHLRPVDFARYSEFHAAARKAFG